MSSLADPMVVILSVDLLGRAFFDEDAARVLFLWRDHQVRPAVCGALLVRYFKLLRGLGLTDREVRRWGWWFGSPDKSVYVEDELIAKDGFPAAYERLAARTGARYLVHGVGPDGDDARLLAGESSLAWMSASEFLSSFPSPRGG